MPLSQLEISAQMTETEISAAIASAERDILARLSALEKTIGRPVQDLRLDLIEATQLAEERPRWIRDLRIIMQPRLEDVDPT